MSDKLYFDLIDADALVNVAKLFDTKGYLDDYKDLKDANVDGFQHFIDIGWKEGRVAFFNVNKGERIEASKYLSQTFIETFSSKFMFDFDYSFAKSVVGKLFEPDEYILKVGNAAPHNLLLDHFLVCSLGRQISPSFWFDYQTYLSKHEDIKNSKIEPFLHFCMSGFSEGRIARVFDNIEEFTDLSIAARKPVLINYFDHEFYLKEYNDIPHYDGEPIEHYLNDGWKEGRFVNNEHKSLFSKDDLHFFGALKVDTVCFHFAASKGWLASDFPHEIREKGSRGSFGFSEQVMYEAETIKKYFDEKYYLEVYSDVKDSGVDPIVHYCHIGWKEGRNPSLDFDTKFYLSDNIDVLDCGVNPFYHYVVSGVRERRYPLQPGGYKAIKIWQSERLEDKIAHWYLNDKVDLLSVKELSQNMSEGKVCKTSVISISHDNYINSMGGIQTCLLKEQKLFNKQGINYVHLFPYQPLPTLSKENKPINFIYGININGKFLGYIKASSLIEVLSEDIENINGILIHALQGSSPEVIKEISLACNQQVVLWLHDNFTICPSFTLQRNDVDFCRAPEVTSNACFLCLYGEERRTHIPRIENLLNSIKKSLIIVSPSDFTEQLWRSKFQNNDYESCVLEHTVLLDPNPKQVSKEVLGFAYIGIPAFHKGWNDFVSIFKKLHNNDHVFFKHIGSVKSDIDVIDYVDAKGDIISALKKEDIDFAIIPSNIPETFNLIVHEAIASGLKILCFKESGNIARAVNKYNAGYSFDKLEDLISFIESFDYKGTKTVDKTHFKEKQSELSYSILKDKGCL